MTKTTIKQINTITKNGISSGDNYKKCHTGEKSIYFIRNVSFDIDTIRCPSCVTEFKQEVANIQIKKEKTQGV